MHGPEEGRHLPAGGGNAAPGTAMMVGVGEPVGSGKTMLVERVTRRMAPSHDIGVVTNDTSTCEDAEFFVVNSVLPAERIKAVETGGCPHTAIPEEASANLEAVEELLMAFPSIEVVFVESWGDNLTSTFLPELADLSIFMIDVAQGEKIPRKGGPGIGRSDLLVINKIDLAPYVGADLTVMAHDAAAQRGTRPVLFSDLSRDIGVGELVDFIVAALEMRGA